MKKTMKLLAAALAGTLVLGGCAGNKETTAASAESETVKETEAQSTEAESSQAEAETEKEEASTENKSQEEVLKEVENAKAPDFRRSRFRYCDPRWLFKRTYLYGTG